MGLHDDDILRLGTRKNRSNTISGDERWITERFNRINEVIRKPSISRIPKLTSNASENTFVTAQSHTQESQGEPKVGFDEYGKGYQAGYRMGFEAGCQACQADRKDSVTIFSRMKDSKTPACLEKSIGDHAASGQIPARRYNKSGPETQPRIGTVDSSMSCTQYMQTTYHHVTRPGRSMTVGSVCSTITQPGRAITVDSGVTSGGHVSKISRPSHELQNFPRRDLHPVPNGPFTESGTVQGVEELPQQNWRSRLPPSSKIPTSERQGWRPTRGLVSHIPDSQKGKWQPWGSSDRRNYET
jgi:hypothetical protein